MKNITRLFILFFIIISTNLFSQTLVNNGSNIHVTQGTTMVIVGNYLNLADGDIKNSGLVTIGGDLTNNAVAGNLLQGSTGQVALNGAATQTIGGSTPTWFSKLKLMQETELQSNIFVSDSLELDNASIRLNAKNLLLEPDAGIKGFNDQAYVVAGDVGQLQRLVGNQEFLFPVGTSSSYTPIALSNNGVEDQYGVSVFTDVLDGGLSGNTIAEIEDCVKLTWNIQEMTENGSQLNIEAFWNNTDEGANFDRMHSGMGYFAGGNWVPQDETQAVGSGPFSISRSGVTATGAFAVGDLESPMVYTLSLVNQQIVITEGWSGISSYINPANANVEAIFQPIINELIILQSDAGMYWPGENVNTIGTWDAYIGYKIKVTNQVELTITGTMVENVNVELSAGWNLIPVLSVSPVDVAALFEGLDVIMVKDVAGFGIFWPDYNINTLQVLEPGKSYFVLAGSSESISFGSQNLKDVTEQPVPAEIDSPWTQSATSPYSHVIAFHQDALSFFLPGDVLALFDKNGNCSGLAEYSGNDFAVVAFGNDLLADNARGFIEGDQIDYKLFRSSMGETYDVEVEYENRLDYSGKFAINGLSAVNGLKMSPSALSTEINESLGLYPNPTNGVFHITGIDVESSILVYNSIGEVFYNYRDFGLQKIDMSGNPKGLYIVKISNNENSVYRKFILQ